jgi:hypothetical protein
MAQPRARHIERYERNEIRANDVWLYSAARWRSTAQYELQQRAYLKKQYMAFFSGRSAGVDDLYGHDAGREPADRPDGDGDQPRDQAGANGNTAIKSTSLR